MGQGVESPFNFYLELRAGSGAPIHLPGLHYQPLPRPWDWQESHTSGNNIRQAYIESLEKQKTDSSHQGSKHPAVWEWGWTL